MDGIKNFGTERVRKLDGMVTRRATISGQKRKIYTRKWVRFIVNNFLFDEILKIGQKVDVLILLEFDQCKIVTKLV